MEAPRKPLTHAPTESFTMNREQFKQFEDIRLVKHFGVWLTKVSGHSVSEESFEDDLLDGIALCKLMTKINGSQLTVFHELNSGIPALDKFKSKENMVAFQLASKNLKLPITFGSEDLEKKNISRVVSSLIFLAHVCHSQGVTVSEMGPELVKKCVEIDVALGGSDSASLSWFQQLLIKLGLGDWFASLNMEAIKEYVATLKHNLETKVESQKTMVRSQSGRFFDILPEAVKARIPASSLA